MEIYSRDMEPTGKPQKPARMEVTLSPRLLSLLRQLQTSPACASSSPTFDEGLQGQYLRRIREELYAIQETCGVAHWPPPVAGGPQADGDAAGEASFSADEDGERLGWMVLLLKLHQTFASLLAPASSEEGEEARENGDVSTRRPQSPGKRRSPLLGKQSPSASKGWRIQTNEFEISSLWQLLQAAPGGGGTSPDVVPRGGDRGPMPSGPGCAAAILSSNLSGLLTRQGSLADPRVGSAASGGLEAHTESRTEPGLWASLPALHRPGGDRPEEALPFDLVFELRRGCWTSVCRQQQAAQLRELQHQQSQLTSSFLHSRPSSFRSLGSSSLPSSSTPCGFPFSTGAPHAVDAGGTSPLAVPDAASDLGGSKGFGGPQPQISRPVCPFCAPSLASLVHVEERGDSTIPGASRLRVTLAIDSEVLHFCCCSGGRFDAYFTALVAHLILAGCGAQGKGHLCPAPPASAASESLCDGRAKDAKPGESGDKKLQVPGGRDPRKAVGEENEKHSSGSKNRRRGANRAQRVSRGSPVSPSAAAYQSREEGREEANLGTNKENSVSSPETRLSLSHLGDNTPNGCGAVPSTPLGDSVELEPSPSSPASAGDPASQASALSRLTAAFVSRLRFPDFFPSTEAMVTRRAHHAMRVVLDSSRSGLTPGEAAAGGRGGSVGCWRMTKEKFNWHVTLLTSAAVEAVRDCFADLTLDVWHSCFYGSAAQVTGAKCASRDRLEQLLIALLGNNDALIRLEAVKLLNAFYDRHDWQLRQPFVPVIKNVGDRFVLSVLIETCTLCDDATSKEPSDVFAIVAAPSFSRFSTAEIYSYHTFSWVLLQSLPSPQSVAEHPSVSAEAGDTSRQWRKQRWLGTADFGVFTRCGFYDWRICRAKESDGSWWVVERAVSYGALSGQSTAPFPTASAAVLSAPLVPAEPADASVEEKMDNSGDMSAQKRRVSRRLAAEAAAGAAAAHAAAAALDAAFPMKSPNPHHLRLLKRFEEQRQFDAATSSRANYDHRKKLLDECIPLQGRVVVLPKDSRNLQLHEVFVDSHEAQWDEETGKLTQRGNFACIAESLPTLAEAGVTATLVSGVMERDSGDVVYDVDGDFDYANPDASPFASVCRAAPCGLLGGVGGFLEVVQEARRVGMKILVQMASGVSASHPHRRYASHLLHFEDADGKKQILYGGETLGVLPQETAILNYRKLETWQLFIDDLKMWIKKFGIDGVRISNAQELPQILAADAHALSRKDADGQFHYAAQDIIMGEVVVPHSSSLGGYWSLASLGAPSFSALASFRSASSLLSVPAGFAYANPFYVKLCRSVWLESPDFLFIGECWTELEQLRHLQDMQATHATQASPLESLGLGTTPAVSELPGHRSGEIPTLASLSATEFSVVPSLLVSSGIVPQMQLFPTVLPAVLGKKPAILPLCPSSHEGNSACMEAASLRQTQLRTPLLSLPPRFLFSALFAMHHNLPRGSILIQSSCTPASPLPALLYGRAAWAAVDLLMLLPDVPCT
ncbi:putative glycogen synthase, partial [Toxoplasma gondii VAND]